MSGGMIKEVINAASAAIKVTAFALINDSVFFIDIILEARLLSALPFLVIIFSKWTEQITVASE